MGNFSLFQKFLEEEKHRKAEQAKKALQEYEIELGFEKIKVLVPIQESSFFENELSKLEEDDTKITSYVLEKIAKKYNGYIQD